MTPETAAALVRSLFCGFRPGQNRVAVFVAFSDESGTGDPTGEFLVSGYSAEEKEWPFVASTWQERILDGPPRIPYLHMVELRNQEWRARYGISYLQSQDRISEAVKVLSHSGSLRIVTSRINRSDLSAIIHARYKHKQDIPIYLSEPDYFCFLAYSVFTIAGVSKEYPNAERVDFVVSRKQKVTHHIEQAHADIGAWLGSVHPQLKGMMGDIIPASMEQRLPLQAADLTCWHQQRFYANTETAADYHRRFALMGLHDNNHVHQWEPRELLGIADALMPRKSEY